MDQGRRPFGAIASGRSAQGCPSNATGADVLTCREAAQRDGPPPWDAEAEKGDRDMIDLLEELERDHLNMAALLRVLERQVELFRRGQSPDYEIIEAIVAYFLDYPDLIHHPKEDILARRLMAKHGAAASVLAGLPERHTELGRLTRSFAEVLTKVLDQVELERDRFVHAAEDFIEAQRHHMEMEGQHFFPLVRHELTPDDLTDAALETLEREDPLFGHRAQPRFEALRRMVLEAETG